ncbi:hypothetical protein M8818_002401 [Zalaria obscura]|uniref:Uncharacterized protein n=1 Tax=Zalaria obscura TaxID=2024903 RepID=A0ACC3SJP6_9PEZI
MKYISDTAYDREDSTAKAKRRRDTRYEAPSKLEAQRSFVGKGDQPEVMSTMSRAAARGHWVDLSAKRLDGHVSEGEAASIPYYSACDA